MLIMLSILAALSSGPAGSELCGRSYQSIVELNHDLRSDPKVSHFAAKGDLTVYYDQERATLWWVKSTNKKPNIVSCKRKIPTENGFVDGSVEADCNADRSGLCAVQVSRMAAVKF